VSKVEFKEKSTIEFNWFDLVYNTSNFDFSGELKECLKSNIVTICQKLITEIMIKGDTVQLCAELMQSEESYNQFLNYLQSKRDSEHYDAFLKFMRKLIVEAKNTEIFDKLIEFTYSDVIVRCSIQNLRISAKNRIDSIENLTPLIDTMRIDLVFDILKIIIEEN
jgi:hypothetical protein